MGAADSQNSAGCLFQSSTEFRVVCCLEVKHTRHQLQAVLHPMIDLLQEQSLVFERRLQSALMTLPLYGHAQNVGCSLQESDVVLAELAFGAAVDFEHAIRSAIALENHVHGAADTVHREQFGGPEPLLAFQ